jgi:hypothetical protein
MDGASGQGKPWLQESAESVWAVLALDEKRVACASESHVTVHAVPSGEILGRLLGHSDYVRTLLMLPNSTVFVSGSWDGEVRFWDVGSYRQCGRLTPGQTIVTSFAARPDGRQLAIGFGNGIVQQYDLLVASDNALTCNLVRTISASSRSTTALAYDPSGQLLLAGSADGEIAAWKPGTEERIWRRSAHKGAVAGLKVTGESVFSGGNDGRIVSVGLHDGSVLLSREPVADQSISSIDLTPDGRFLLAGGSKGSVTLYGIDQDRFTTDVFRSRCGALLSVSFSNDGKLMAVGGENGAAALLVDALPEIAQGRDEPCNLTLSIAFSDSACATPNNALDGAETEATFTVRASNAGPGCAYGTVLRINKDHDALDVAASVTTGNIQPGRSAKWVIPVAVDPDVANGHARFVFSMEESRGFSSMAVPVDLEVRSLTRPRLEVAEVRVEDRGGRASGNGDGVIQNGEVIDLQVFIKNAGPGPAFGVILGISLDDASLQISDQRTELGDISPGAIGEGGIVVRVPRERVPKAVLCHIRAQDRRSGVAQVTIDQELRSEALTPVLHFALDLGAALVRNGTRTGFNLVPRNDGLLDAQDVTIMVASRLAAATIEPSTPVLVGAIKASSRAIPRSFDVTLRRGFQALVVPIEIRMTQAGFASSSDTLTIPVSPQQPDLQIEATARGAGSSEVLKSGPLEISALVRNRGTLDAEDVRLAISYDAAPGGARLVFQPAEVFLGRIPAGETTPATSFTSTVPRAMGGDAVHIRLDIAQSDFDKVTNRMTVALSEPAAMPATGITATPPSPAPLSPLGADSPTTEIKVSGLPADSTIRSETWEGAFVSASDSRGLRSIEVLLNGRRLGRVQCTDKLETLPFRITGMKEGRNELAIVVQNQQDFRRRTIGLTYAQTAASAMNDPSDVDVDPPQGRERRSHGVAVIIGNRDYTSPDIPPVEYADRDAAAVGMYADTLLGYEDVRVLSNVTKNDLVKWFGDGTAPGKLRGIVREGETDLFVYYSGHGAPDIATKESYLLPVDCDPEYIVLTGYRLATLYRSLQRLNARSLVVVIDACFSGQTDPGQSLIKGASPVKLVVDETTLAAPNSVALASTSENQVSSWYQDKRHSLFTYYYLKGVRGSADANRDGVLELGELRPYLSHEVSVGAERLRNRSQTPRITGDDHTVIARY